MITVRNLKIIENLPFEDYITLPGISFSTIKYEGKTVAPTRKMMLGSAVDDYLSHQSDTTCDLNLIKPIAQTLISRIGLDLYTKLEKQISVTCDFIFEDMLLRYKGRIDWGLQSIIVIDLKIAENIDKTLFYFDYPNQVSGYSIALSCQNSLILAINPKTLKTDLKHIKVNSYWWERQILRLGAPVWQN